MLDPKATFTKCLSSQQRGPACQLHPLYHVTYDAFDSLQFTRWLEQPLSLVEATVRGNGEYPKKNVSQPLRISRTRETIAALLIGRTIPPRGPRFPPITNTWIPSIRSSETEGSGAAGSNYPGGPALISKLPCTSVHSNNPPDNSKSFSGPAERVIVEIETKNHASDHPEDEEPHPTARRGALIDYLRFAEFVC